MTPSEYRKLLNIDKNSLDDVLVEQADIFYEISHKYSIAVSKRDQAYENIKVTDAELNLAVRINLDDEGRKVTESLINNMVLEHEEHKEAVKTHLEAKKLADQYSALKEAFHQRSYMLRELVQLYISGYFVQETYKATKEKKTQVDHTKAVSAISSIRKRNDRRRLNENTR